MHAFTDTQGRDWRIAVSVNTIKRVRDEADGFDLMKVVEDKSTIDKLTNDPFTLVAVLYGACHPQATAEGVSPEEFGEAMGSGDVLDAASTALLEELADFFPPHRRGPMKAAIRKLREIQTRAATMATERIDSPEMMASAVAALESALASPPPMSGNSSSDAPESSASTPDPSHSAS